jgi:hypothetical protein
VCNRRVLLPDKSGVPQPDIALRTGQGPAVVGLSYIGDGQFVPIRPAGNDLDGEESVR